MAALNATHDPARRSWVESANAPGTDFPIQNLPLGIFRHGSGAPRGGVAIGEQILDIGAALDAGLFSGTVEEAALAARGPVLNPLMALGNDHASALRGAVSGLLDANATARADLMVPMAEAVMALPAAIGSFTDFLCSWHHTVRMFPPGQVPQSFKALPIAYHSRASSVRVSGEAVMRPNGQYRTADDTLTFGPEPRQDFELELGAFIGQGNPLGHPIPIDEAGERVFGYCLLNDWSARGIQGWEMAPLGPFLSKSLSTSISPWVVTAEAMSPFRAPAHARDPGEEPLAYLSAEQDRAEGGVDLAMEAWLLTPRMREAGTAPERITATNFTNCYWTFAQMVAHHASNGCNLQPGDLLGSGTMSGPSDDSRACIAELTGRGIRPLRLPGGETRAWLEDGDEVIFRARAGREGFVSIGLGECRGRIEPAPPWPAAQA